MTIGSRSGGSPRTALVVGATGLVGTQLVDRLLASPRWSRVIALVRRPLARAHAKLDARVADFDALADGSASDDFAAADALFCALGTTIRTAGSQQAFRRVDHDYPVAVARHARAAGASTCVIVSAAGADARSRVFYSRVKGEVEAAIAAQGWPRWYALRPSFLLGDRSESRPGERVGIALAQLVSPVLVGGLRRYRPVEAAQVAKAMLVLAEGGRAPGVVESDEVARL
jgi:uncharacterized protein YbjT (DUF2867 family)